jgi:hypothetical protein
VHACWIHRTAFCSDLSGSCTRGPSRVRPRQVAPRVLQNIPATDGKGSCCNLTDCRPTSGRTVDGHYEVKVNGTWISVLQTKIIRQSAPDGGYHVCVAACSFPWGLVNLFRSVVVSPNPLLSRSVHGVAPISYVGRLSDTHRLPIFLKARCRAFRSASLGNLLRGTNWLLGSGFSRIRGWLR